MAGHKWEFSVSEPQMLVLALYVRDAAELKPATDPAMPALSPAVPIQPGLLSKVSCEVAAQEWAGWWQQLWLMAAEDPPQRVVPLPEDVPDVGEPGKLQELVRTLFPEAIHYCTARAAERKAEAREGLPDKTPEARVLTQATRRKGLQRARPVRLRVTELPVTSEQGWHDPRGHVVVTRPLRRNVAAYQQWLRPLVEAVARPMP